ncbi:MAG: hypothetical protein V4629_01190 [Pseudomonadota bacterium]
MATALGYQWFIKKYHLKALPLDYQAMLDSRIQGKQKKKKGNHEIEIFGGTYQPEESCVGHI